MRAKLVASDAWNWPDAPARAVKLARRGLVGADRQLFLKAAAIDFLPYLDEIRPGEVPIHYWAIGATERYGPNRNGDGFKAATLVETMPSFEKHAHFFEDHKNKSDSPRYGRIVKAAYNPIMQRGELLIAAFETKAAAEAAAGELGRVAERTLQKLASGQDLGGSMCCFIDYDVCSGCGNKAANRRQYCDEVERVLPDGRTIPACPRGGCRSKLASLCPDGHVLHVDNPPPLVFVDFSDVGRPADRNALAFGRLSRDVLDSRVF